MSTGTSLNEVMLRGGVATGSSEWFDVSECESLTVHIAGITSATVEIHGMNTDQTRPAKATDGVVLATTTVSDLIYIPGPINYIKVKITAWVSGTVTADLAGC